MSTTSQPHTLTKPWRVITMTWLADGKNYSRKMLPESFSSIREAEAFAEKDPRCKDGWTTCKPAPYSSSLA